jgi:hypothetical protein
MLLLAAAFFMLYKFIGIIFGGLAMQPIWIGEDGTVAINCDGFIEVCDDCPKTPQQPACGLEPFAGSQPIAIFSANGRCTYRPVNLVWQGGTKQSATWSGAAFPDYKPGCYTILISMILQCQGNVIYSGSIPTNLRLIGGIVTGTYTHYDSFNDLNVTILFNGG